MGKIIFIMNYILLLPLRSKFSVKEKENKPSIDWCACAVQLYDYVVLILWNIAWNSDNIEVMMLLLKNKFWKKKNDKCHFFFLNNVLLRLSVVPRTQKTVLFVNKHTCHRTNRFTVKDVVTSAESAARSLYYLHTNNKCT